MSILKSPEFKMRRNASRINKTILTSINLAGEENDLKILLVVALVCNSELVAVWMVG